MHCNIRLANEGDLKYIYRFICALEDNLFDQTLFESIFNKNIHHKDYYYYIAESDGNIIGYISCHTQYLLHHCGKVAEIQELFVEASFRNCGIGKLLLVHLEKVLRAEGCVSLEVTAQNKRQQTHQFYERYGFECSHKKFVKVIG